MLGVFELIFERTFATIQVRRGDDTMKPKSDEEEKKPLFAKLKYHFGIKLVAFPSSDQKTTIKQNSDAARFIYN